MSAVDDVGSLRAGLWAAGFRPVPVFNPDTKVTSPGKQPLGEKWQLCARETPPFCARSPAVLHALNTGILADGLRPIDVDVNDPEKAGQCVALAVDMLGEAPIRTRENSPRSLVLYRAAEGEPAKRTLTSRSHTEENACKIEVLGRGQQFVAFGRHPSGSELVWSEPPGQETRDALPAVTEDQIQAYLEACAQILDAPLPPQTNGHDPDHPSADPQADSLRIAAALAAIPNHGPADWEAWNRVGMAVWRATGGSSAGWEAFNAWSQRNQAYNADATRTRWGHYTTSPPTSIGAGTIFHMAAESAGRLDRDDPGPTSEPTPHDPITDKHDADPAVADFLSAITWANLEIKPERRLLGDFVTSSTRAFIAGATGIGKTMFIYAMVGGMATGQGFLHWTCDRPSKWLIIDGEMPQVLVKARSADLLRRGGALIIPPHGVTIYSRDREDEFAVAFPHLGRMAPLNTAAGHTFVQDLIASIGGVDGIVLDNVMSLAPGDQKDEEIWAGCIPLVEYLSRKGIAQIWLDHTGHNTARQYGSSTKSWRFDVAAMLTPLTGDDEPTPGHLAFKLSFEKARRRTPANWREFVPQVVRLVDDAWSAEPVDRSQTVADKGLSDKAAALFDLIKATLNRYGSPQQTEESGKEHIAVERKTVRKHLIKAGWFSEGNLLSDPPKKVSDRKANKDDPLSAAFQKDGYCGKPTRAGLSDENNQYRSLKRKGIIDFTRDHVWRP